MRGTRARPRSPRRAHDRSPADASLPDREQIVCPCRRARDRRNRPAAPPGPRCRGRDPCDAGDVRLGVRVRRCGRHDLPGGRRLRHLRRWHEAGRGDHSPRARSHRDNAAQLQPGREPHVRRPPVRRHRDLERELAQHHGAQLDDHRPDGVPHGLPAQREHPVRPQRASGLGQVRRLRRGPRLAPPETRRAVRDHDPELAASAPAATRRHPERRQRHPHPQQRVRRHQADRRRPPHADSLQLYGASNTVIRGNYFHDVDVAIMAPDGGRTSISPTTSSRQRGYCPRSSSAATPAPSSPTTSPATSRHMDAKGGEPASRDGTCATTSWSTAASTSPTARAARAAPSPTTSSPRTGQGTNAIVAQPTFTGGNNPTTFPGWALAAGSPGKGNATDGTDRGIRVGQSDNGPAPPAGPPATPGAPEAVQPGTAGRRSRPRLRLLTGKRAIRRRGRLRLRVRAVAAGTVVVRSTIRPKRRPRARPIRLRRVVLRFAKAGHRRTVTFRLSRNARRRLGRWGRPRLVVRTFADAKQKRRTGRFVLAIRR